MAKLRVHELAKQLGRENKDIIETLSEMGHHVTSHMSTVDDNDCEKIRRKYEKKNMTNESEKRNELNTSAKETNGTSETKAVNPATEEAKPKKKNIIQVFRPQNSKTGMVRPGQRPGQTKPAQAKPRTAASAAGTTEKHSSERPSAAVEKKTAEAVKTPAETAKTVAPVKAAEAQQTAAKAAETAAPTTAAPATAAPAAHKAETVKPQNEKPVTAPAQNQTEKATDSQAVKPQETTTQNTTRYQGQNTQSGSRYQGQNSQSGSRYQGQNGQGGNRYQGQNSQGGNRYQGQNGQNSQGGNRYQGQNGQNSQGGNRYQGQNGQGGNRYQGQNGQGGNRYQGQNGQGGNRYQGQNGQGGNRYQGQNGQGGNRYQGQNGQGGNRYQGQNGQDGNRYQGQNSQGGNRYQGQNGQGGNRPYASRDGRPSDGGRFQRNDRPGDGRNAMAGRGPAGSRMNGAPKAAGEAKPLEKEGRMRNDRAVKNEHRNDKPGKGEKLDRMERGRATTKPAGKGRPQAKPVKPEPKPVEKEEVIKNIIIPETLTIKELAEKMKLQPAAIVKKLFLQGTMVTVNQEISFETAEEIALEYNCFCEKEVKVDVLEELLKEEEEAAETMTARPPVVCVMGHVDHGKTSLLDAIRNTHVIDREAGGITQHIGASVINCNGQKITFLDTPGHEAFTAMRMRGANATDIAILVVAADDGVMPQTVEAINHAKAAGIEIIVAVNKIDKPSANIERVKQELTEYELIPEDWGGSTIFVPVSAHTHEGIDTLLEMILLTSEVLELKANAKRQARGLVIEAQLDKGRGPVATVLVQKGTLHVGDPICAGSCYGKVRAMTDDKGRKVKEATPSTPVEILGFSDVPNAGEIFIAPETEKEARSFAETFISEGREKLLEDTKARMSLDDLFTQIKAGNLKELNLIVKADVQGSVEAVKQSLLKLSNEEVVVKIIHGGVGAINESDVILASASNAIIIGFNVRPDAMAKTTAERQGVDVRLYRVIYDAIADVEAAMKGMLDPIFEEKVIGHAEVRQIFKASGVGTIAGSYVLDGMFQRGCSVRITREGTQIFEGTLASLKRFKDDVKEVKAGYECGLVFEKFNDVKEEDQVEAYMMVEVPR